MLNLEQEKYLSELTFSELSHLLVDLYYRTGSKEEETARSMRITLDMVNAELTARIYHTEFHKNGE